MATCAQLQQRLADAEDAYHASQINGSVTLTSTGSKELRNAAVDLPGLLRYIATLRSQVAACTGVPDTSARRAIHIQPEDSGSRFRRRV